MCTKSFVGCGFGATDTTRGAYSAPPDPLTVFRGATSKGRGEGERRKGKGERRGREGEGEGGSLSFAVKRKRRKVGVYGWKCKT